MRSDSGAVRQPWHWPALVALLAMLLLSIQAHAGAAMADSWILAGAGMPGDSGQPQSQGNGDSDAAILPAPPPPPVPLLQAEGGTADAALSPVAPLPGARRAVPSPYPAAGRPAVLGRATLRLRGPPDTA